MSLFSPRRYLATISQTSITETSHTSTLPDISRLYSRSIQRCIENKSLTDTKGLHARILKLGLVGQYVGNKLTDGYLKCGSTVDARKLFEELPERAIITWNSLISHYVVRKNYTEALSLCPRMVLEGVLPDRFTFLSVFKALTELGLPREARKAHGMSVVLGLEVSDVFVGSSIVDMYAKLGKMREAESVADRVRSKDVVLFTALIVGFAQNGDSRKALESFGKMAEQGIMANEYTFASVLISCGNFEDSNLGRSVHGLIVKSGFELVVASQTSLLTMYARCGLVDDSLKIFENFVNPNQVTWSSLIVALVQNGKEETALKKFKEMIRGSKMRPNSFTLSGIIQACSRLAVLEGGRQVHGLTLKFGLDCDRYAGSALVEFYGKCGTVESARSVFDTLIEPDLASTNSMIYSYAQSGLGREAIELFQGMRVSWLEPNEVTVLSVLLACNNAGMVEQGCEIFASVKKNGSSVLTREHYACMVNLLGRSGRLEEAESLVREVENPDVVLWRTLLGACRVHGEVEMAERTVSQLRSLAPEEDGATHILMSNLYASKGNWGKVAEIKSSMRTMKVKKERAVSWVEVDKEVHTFMAGDWSHPRSSEIREMLETLLKKVNGLGYVPDTRCVMQKFEEEDKKSSLYHHSERLAIAFALLVTRDRNFLPIRIFKNLRVCGDCHAWIKLVTKAVGREIIARDAKRFHRFKDGVCSCGDYW